MSDIRKAVNTLSSMCTDYLMGGLDNRSFLSNLEGFFLFIKNESGEKNVGEQEKQLSIIKEKNKKALELLEDVPEKLEVFGIIAGDVYEAIDLLAETIEE